LIGWFWTKWLQFHVYLCLPQRTLFQSTLYFLTKTNFYMIWMILPRASLAVGLRTHSYGSNQGCTGFYTGL
jgi:hypothetical protein